MVKKIYINPATTKLNQFVITHNFCQSSPVSQGWNKEGDNGDDGTNNPITTDPTPGGGTFTKERYDTGYGNIW